MTALGSVDILVRSGPGDDPYFHLLMSDHPVRWWKIWFFLRNYADAPLPVFMGSRPRPPSQLGVRCGPNRSLQGANPTRGRSEITVRGTNGCRDRAGLFQP
jgi:hypothetical protein